MKYDTTVSGLFNDIWKSELTLTTSPAKNPYPTTRGITNFKGLLIIFLTFIFYMAPNLAKAHVDPVLTEHAHMEYEAAFGTSLLGNLDVGGNKVNLLAWDFEVNLPMFSWFSVEWLFSYGDLFNATQNEFILGDVEIEPRFILFDNKKIIVNFATPVLFPTGTEGRGLSEGLYAIEPTVRFDFFLPNLAIYTNTTIGIGLSRQHLEFVQNVAGVYQWAISPDTSISPILEFSGRVGSGESFSLTSGFGLGASYKKLFWVAETLITTGDETSWEISFRIGYHEHWASLNRNPRARHGQTVSTSHN